MTQKQRKTKIVCTLGPATDNEAVLRELIKEGMNVARLNFSHGTHEEQKKRLDTLKTIREEMHAPIAAMLDTKGPEIRLKTFVAGAVNVQAGQMFSLCVGDFAGDEHRVCISYEDLYKDVAPGTHILIDDGLIDMEVTSIEGTTINCKVLNGGRISDRKGVNVPNVELGMPFINERDYSDILFAIENDFDFIAASFTRKAEDILEIRRILEENNGGNININIIAKIENKQGIDNIDEIIQAADGIMVARGDMGVELPFEEVPILQKMIIEKVYMAGKQVITATQMLESMIKNPRPTRAEATDVANAIYDGTSAIMLSGETAAGAYPVEALKTMVKIARRTEADINYGARMRKRNPDINTDITNAIAHATCTTALDLDAAAIITPTTSGRTARMISKYRSDSMIIGGCTDPKVCRQLNMSWGVTPMLIEKRENSDALFEHAVNRALEEGLIREGDVVVLTAGIPLGIAGTSNMIKVNVAGHIPVSGTFVKIDRNV